MPTPIETYTCTGILPGWVIPNRYAVKGGWSALIQTLQPSRKITIGVAEMAPLNIGSVTRALDDLSMVKTIAILQPNARPISADRILDRRPAYHGSIYEPAWDITLRSSLVSHLASLMR
jgi:hypothetical protein